MFAQEIPLSRYSMDYKFILHKIKINIIKLDNQDSVRI